MLGDAFNGVGGMDHQQEGENDEGGDKRPRRRLTRAIYNRVEADLYDIMASSQRISKRVQ